MEQGRPILGEVFAQAVDKSDRIFDGDTGLGGKVRVVFKERLYPESGFLGRKLGSIGEFGYRFPGGIEGFENERAEIHEVPPW